MTDSRTSPNETGTVRQETDGKTCHVECFDDGVDEGMDGEWFSYAPPTWYLSCGHTCEGGEKPAFCPTCGKEVVDDDR